MGKTVAGIECHRPARSIDRCVLPAETPVGFCKPGVGVRVILIFCHCLFKKRQRFVELVLARPGKRLVKFTRGVSGTTQQYQDDGHPNNEKTGLDRSVVPESN
jgi:hypothetical protein